MKQKTVSFLGWYGVLAILAAYALLSFSVIGPHTFFYQFLNLTGAAGLVVEACSKKDYQPVVLNLVWLLVAGVAILQIAYS